MRGMRILVAAVTAVFLLIGSVGLTGGIFGLFTIGPIEGIDHLARATDWTTPDAPTRVNALIVISFSVLLLSAAALFAKANWPRPNKSLALPALSEEPTPNTTTA